MSARRLLLAVVSLLWFASAPVQAQKADAQTVLDKWAAALGGRQKLQAVLTTYTRTKFTIGGLNGTVESWETSTGQRRERQQISAGLDTLTVFDGHEAWTRVNGKVRPLSGPDSEEQVTNAYLASFAQFFPGRRPGRVEYAGDEGGTHILRLLPEHGRPVTVYVDKATGLPARQVQRAHDRDETFYCDAYREFDGLRFCSAGRQTTGDVRYEARIAVDEIRLNPPLEAGMFDRPAPIADVRFAGNAPSVVAPFELVGNNIWVQVKVNGSKPQWMIWDTGAEMTVFNAARAHEFDLKAEGALEGRGVDEHSVDTGIIKDVRLGIAGAELEPRPLMAVDLSLVESLTGRRITAVLGFDVLSSFVFEIDYAGRKLTLHDPRRFRPADKETVVPFLFQGNVPTVEAAVTLPGRAPITGRFLLDTGANHALSLNAPFVAEHGMVQALGKAAVETVGFGVGGETKEVAARFTKLTLGPFEFEGPVARLSLNRKGGAADPDLAGLIGGDVLRRFTVTFDYAAQRLYLKPNAALHDPFERDMSGLVLTSEGPQFQTRRVYRVLSNSPAAEIGIQKGDLLLNLEGRPAADFTFDQLDEMFQLPGKQYRIEIERDGRRIPLVLKTRRLV